MHERWLKCSISQGMFSNERAVTCRANVNERISFFAPRDQVAGDIDQAGRVRVRVFHQGGTVWADLPTENQDQIPIDEADLVSEEFD